MVSPADKSNLRSPESKHNVPVCEAQRQQKRPVARPRELLFAQNSNRFKPGGTQCRQKRSESSNAQDQTYHPGIRYRIERRNAVEHSLEKAAERKAQHKAARATNQRNTQPLR